jgi:hypothetical protein
MFELHKELPQILLNICQMALRTDLLAHNVALGCNETIVFVL